MPSHAPKPYRKEVGDEMAGQCGGLVRAASRRLGIRNVDSTDSSLETVGLYTIVLFVSRLPACSRSPIS